MDYSGNGADELSFVKGDVIYVPANNDGDKLQGVLKGKVSICVGSGYVVRELVYYCLSSPTVVGVVTSVAQ